jgi:hypothetical protein
VTAYLWRDPARNTPARLTELAARDRRLARYERRGPDGQAAERAARIAEFTAYRNAGLTGPQASDLMGINRSTGRGYERARRRRP